MKPALILAGLTALAGMTVQAGCSKPAPAQTQAQAQSDYAPPPELTTARFGGAAGGVSLRGAASPQSRVRLASPDGVATAATAGANGVWTVVIPAADRPRLISLSEELGGRVVRARGYLAILPGAAAMLRPTAGARPLLAPGRAPRIGAVDFDAAGAGVVSGRAGPDRAVRVLLDERDAGEGRTDGAGWFDVSLSDNLKAGVHHVTVATPDGRAEQLFDGRPAAAISAPPMNASRTDGAWRLDWMSPGGGVQSTILFDQPAPPATGMAR